MSHTLGKPLTRIPLILFVAVGGMVAASADNGTGPEDPPRTIGVVYHADEAFDGYTLFAPMASRTTYLIDTEGRLIRSWESEYPPGLNAYFRDNGNLVRTIRVGDNPVFGGGAGGGGGVQEFDWDGTLLWEFVYSSDQYLQHHDIALMPNGNVLLIAWEYKSEDEAIAAGRDPELIRQEGLWPDHIVEIEPNGLTGGNIVWEWHVWDHLIQDFDPTKDNYGVVADHPELIDVNFAAYGVADWTHMNGIAYNAELDQIVLSVHTLSEIWIIDHSTTTEEAAGHSGGNSGKGGDLLYRWGNPASYRAGDASDQTLFAQHDPEWIPDGLPGAGNLLLFNNGRDRPGGQYSSIDELVLPVDAFGAYPLPPGGTYGPDAPVWTYTADPPTDFFSSFASGSQRLPNGNTLICTTFNGTFIEVTPDGEIVWKYINPVTDTGPQCQGTEPGAGAGSNNAVFKIDRYAPGFVGFAGRDLTPGDPVERYPALGDLDADCDVDLADLALFLAAYETCDGDPAHDPAADLDGSGCVDLTDLATLLASYGT